MLQSEGLYLLSVFRYARRIKFEQQKQIIRKHHHLKHGFVCPKRFEQKMSHGHIVFGFFDIILSIPAFSQKMTTFSGSKAVFVTKKKHSYSAPTKSDNCALSCSVVLKVKFPKNRDTVSGSFTEISNS